MGHELRIEGFSGPIKDPAKGLILGSVGSVWPGTAQRVLAIGHRPIRTGRPEDDGEVVRAEVSLQHPDKLKKADMLEKGARPEGWNS